MRPFPQSAASTVLIFAGRFPDDAASMQLTKRTARGPLPVRREGTSHRPVLAVRGTRWLAGLTLALGLLLGAAQAQVTAPAYRWATRAGSIASEDLRDMAVDPAGNYVIVGNLNPGSPTTFGAITVNLPVGAIGGYFAKYDSDGNALWVRTVQGTLVAGAHRVAFDAGGNVYVMGSFAGSMTIGPFTFQSSVNSRDVFIAKLDPNGNVLWARAFGGPLDETTNPSATAGRAGLALSGTNLFATFDFAGSVQIDVGGGVFQVLSSQGAQDVAIVKLDLAGNPLGATQFGGAGNDAPRSLSVDNQGEVVVLAVSDADITLGATTITSRGGPDVVMAKFTQGLQPVWIQSFGSPAEDGPLGLATDPANNIIVSGYAAADLALGPTVLTNQGAFDAFIAKFSAAGQLLWARRGVSTDTNNEVGFFVTTDAGGYIYLSGQFDSTDIRFGTVGVANTSGTTATFIMKFDPNGSPLWAQSASATIGFGFSGGSPTTSLFGAGPRIGYDQLGRFYLAGRYEGAATFGSFTLTNAGSGDLYMASLAGDFSILQHPQSSRIKLGQTASFSVVTSNTLPVIYQWLFNGTPIPGANGTNYSITNAQTSDSGIYSVRVSGFTGVLISSNATLTVKLPPVITQNPLSRTVTAGSTVTFAANGTGDAPLSFQWFFNGLPLTNALSPTLTLTNVQLANVGLYALQLSNDVDAVFSANAGLFVNAPSIILASPTNQSVIIGSNVTFTVSADGTAPLGYQWRRNGTPINGAVNQSLTLTNAQAGDAGTYDVVVTNPFTSVFSASAVLTVLPPFSISPQPTNAAVTVGGSATLAVGAVGIGAFTGPFTYQWTLNGSPLAGQTSSSLALSSLQLVNSGNYACVVGSPLGPITSSNATLVVFNPFSVGSASFQPGGLFQMTAGGDNGRAYRLETSTNLVTWTPIVTNTVSGGTASFTDSTAAGNVLRFYRIVLLP